MPQTAIPRRPCNQLREHFAAMQDRNSATLRGGILGIPPVDRRADDDRVCVADVGGVVADRYVNAFAPQRVDQGASLSRPTR